LYFEAECKKESNKVNTTITSLLWENKTLIFLRKKLMGYLVAKTVIIDVIF
jgi:hypothetical protein